MSFGDIDLGPATVMLCIGTGLLLATRLVEIYSHRRAAKRTREFIEASRREQASASKKA